LLFLSVWRFFDWHSISVSSILPYDNILFIQKESDSNLTQLTWSPIKWRCATYDNGPKVCHSRSQHSVSTPVNLTIKFKGQNRQINHSGRLSVNFEIQNLNLFNLKINKYGDRINWAMTKFVMVFYELGKICWARQSRLLLWSIRFWF